jgi:hypothetical protein
VHVTRDEKYDWLILNDEVRKFSIGFGIVYWASFRGLFFGIRYLYLWYNHTISVSNGCVGGSSPCGMCLASWYCFHSQCNLVLRMVVRCRPLSSYMWATSTCVWIVLVLVSISFSGLHSLIEIHANGIVVAGVTYLVSCCCSMAKWAFISQHWLKI